MRISHSLLKNYQTCEFKTKVLNIDRVTVEEPWWDMKSRILGILCHAGMEGYLLGANHTEYIRRALKEFTFPDAITEADLDGMVNRAGSIVNRLVRWYQPKRRFTTMLMDGHELIDHKLVHPLPEPIGVFTEVVAKPDWVMRENETGSVWILDWKFSSDLSDPDIVRYDLQAALYQWVLARFGLDVRGTVMVRSLMEEPTIPQLNKDGTMSRRAIRCGWLDYKAALVDAGLNPADYHDMQTRLLPFHQEFRNYRARREVDALWDYVIVPLARKMSSAIKQTDDDDGHFVRHLDYRHCRWCAVRERCIAGLHGAADHPAFNTTRALKKEDA